MMGLVKFRVEDDLKHLMQIEEFRQKVVRAYEVQVEGQGGWGFRVRYKGYRIRFDNIESGVRGLIIYEGHLEEEPATIQQKLLG
jgi:hypothetical protein